ncbi:C2 calcium/lipid-binding plant phosphoribosyltransferase family protein [Prunus dulcis]|uniref:C2 calcium/lipid-binding plant phosphoribosyltransferase family protein n=1 Tax=Prunus dulcis TaxID=3755 RepID=A0A5H2XM44_PRUDU|nr:C2 calcium/lipid-binding plant phosphoribosyltransferase family protein [Prunus dulcis]
MGYWRAFGRTTPCPRTYRGDPCFVGSPQWSPGHPEGPDITKLSQKCQPLFRINTFLCFKWCTIDYEGPLTRKNSFKVRTISIDHNVGCIDIERKALLKLKQGLANPSNRLSSRVGEDCCKWSGVGCNNITGRINRRIFPIAIHGLDYSGAIVSAFGFGGEINPSLLVLKYLVYLDLSMNKFGGVQLPSFIGSLEKLKYLDISSASFGGIIPPNLGNLSGLLYLDLK